MRILRFCILLISVGAVLPLRALQAQTPAPIVVQAISPAGATGAPTVTATTQNAGSLQAAIQALEQIKAANQETLKRQQTILEQLDEIQKAAEQIKIYTKRG